ncbi:hypothetical protein KJZ99_02350 [bacterium]|nr:hypothetical protein [bacterium]
MARTRKSTPVVTWLGHADARVQFAAGVASGRTAHAYLIGGPEGIGKAGVAIEFARHLLCDLQGPQPCGTCNQCVMLRTLQHPDLHLMAPSGRPKDSETSSIESYPKQYAKLREELARNPYTHCDLDELEHSEGTSTRKLATGSSLRVADSRWLHSAAYRKPFQAKRSVFVILNADYMVGDGAQSALLKVLEEPPTSATFLLTASELQRLLPTIRSRCQSIRLLALSPAEVQRGLSDAGFTTREAELSAALSSGNMRKALRFAEMQPEELEKAAVEFLAASAQLWPEKLHEHVNKLLEDARFVDDAFFELMTLFLSDAAASSVGLANAQLHFPSQSTRVIKLATTYPHADFGEAIAAVDRAASSRSAGYTPSLVLTTMAIELHRALGPRVRA